MDEVCEGVGYSYTFKTQKAYGRSKPFVFHVACSNHDLTGMFFNSDAWYAH